MQPGLSYLPPATPTPPKGFLAKVAQVVKNGRRRVWPVTRVLRCPGPCWHAPQLTPAFLLRRGEQTWTGQGSDAKAWLSRWARSCFHVLAFVRNAAVNMGWIDRAFFILPLVHQRRDAAQRCLQVLEVLHRVSHSGGTRLHFPHDGNLSPTPSLSSGITALVETFSML